MTASDHVQSDLFGATAGRPAAVHRLFFALLPDAATRAWLAQAAQSVRAAHPALRARWVAPQRYHATLHFLGEHSSLRQDVVAAAVAAADRLAAEPFEWVLNEAASFHASQPPWILRSAGFPAPLQALWQGLRGALILAGQGRHLERQLTPHVTIAYGDGHALAPAAIEPLAWRVERFGLLHSVSGRADYHRLAEWSLQPGGVQRVQA
ncbi:2'-5' RNA ligase family protein [Rhodanobacter ginsengiterrae]|uniref:2'-5' RNA ligase family protein n=1 Tax=Rhodanobacter ginsengiterrae TaxID=2008451 RepID=UPI003CF13A40